MHHSSIYSSPVIPEIRRAVSAQNSKDDPTIYGPQVSPYDTEALLDSGARIPIHHRQFGLTCSLGG